MPTLQEKIKTRAELTEITAQLRAAGKKIGFTSGAFDLLHAGHVAFLEQAKTECDVLVVAINSDESVKQYKGPQRPLNPEQARAEVVAALAAVDYVFSFNERRNQKNIEALQPHLYFKAGDYQKQELTSSGVAEQYGGQVRILPMTEGVSTTTLLKKIAKIFGGKVAEEVDESARAVTEQREPQKAILVDRDGTINEEVEYLHEPEKFHLLPNAGEGLKKFQDMGYKIAVITAQNGIGLGYFTKEDFFKVNQEMFKQLQPHHVKIDKIYFATESKAADGTNPKSALIEQAREELDLDLNQCIVIGDKTGDLAATAGFDCVKIGVKTGHALGDQQHEVRPDYLAEDLLDAATWVATMKL